MANELSEAVEVGDIRRVKELLFKGADVNMRDPDTGLSPLHAVAKSDNVELLNILLFHRADIDAPDPWGRTPLMLASNKGRVEVVRALVDRGADINFEAAGDWNEIDHFQTALEAACSGGHIEAVRLLLEKGADIQFESGGWYGNPLIAASIEGHVELATLCLQRGVNVNKANLFGDTALHKAAGFGVNNLNVARLLVGREANIDAANEEHETPLMFVCGFGRGELVGEVVEFLLSQGAEINRRDGSLPE